MANNCAHKQNPFPMPTNNPMWIPLFYWPFRKSSLEILEGHGENFSNLNKRNEWIKVWYQGIVDTGLPELLLWPEATRWLISWLQSRFHVFIGPIFYTPAIQFSNYYLHLYQSHTHKRTSTQPALHLHPFTLSLVTGNDFVNTIINTDPFSNRQCWKVIVKQHGKKLVLPSYTLNIYFKGKQKAQLMYVF